VVCGHPDSRSFSRALADAYVSGLPDGVEVETLPLGDLTFDPVLRHGYREFMPADPVIERSQQLVKWADHLVFVFPCWFGNVPSLLKGWFERVMTPGFAFNYSNTSLIDLGLRVQRHLAGRTATIISTYSGPPWYFRAMFTDPVRLVKKENLGFVGIKTTGVLRLGWIDSPRRDSLARREAFLAKVQASASRLPR